ncbi:MAG: site-specific integrase [bacterium]|nr:site-specific integrase [bacterium]
MSNTEEVTMARRRGNNEGSVYQEKSTGRWVAAVSIDGKRRRAIAPTEAAAKRRLREMISQVDSGLPIADGSLTVARLLDDWMSTAVAGKDLSPRTVDLHRWAVGILTETIGKKRIKTLRPEDVETTFTRLATEGHGNRPRPMSRASLIKIRSTLGQALTWAERRQLVPRNVARVVELPSAARATEMGRALTVTQAKVLLSAIEGHRLEALFTLMLMLGLRPGEATGLSWANVDLDQGVVHVRQSLKLHSGHLEVTEKLKTSRSRRSLDAPPQLNDLLRGHRTRQVADRLEVGSAWSNADDLVFTNALGGPIDPANLRRTFRKMTEGANLGHWHPHELRHSTASILSASGVPLEEVADVLGHDGTRMTSLVYRHAVTPTVEAGTRMGEILSD